MISLSKLPHMEVDVGPQSAGRGRQLPAEALQPVVRGLLGDEGFVGLFATSGDGVKDRLRERTVQWQHQPQSKSSKLC